MGVEESQVASLQHQFYHFIRRLCFSSDLQCK